MIQRKGVFLLLTIASLCQAQTNLTLVKQELTDYYDSGVYFSEIQGVLNEAKNNLSQLIKDNSTHKPLAVVLDVDDTAISNYLDLKRVDFGGDYSTRYQLLLKGDEPAIPGMLDFYNFALANHVSIFFISGRPENVRDLTIRVLQKDGYKNWQQIYFKSKAQQDLSTVAFKTAIRQKISQSGYTIVENIGDQYSDLTGGYAQFQYKLPNPFYLIP